jgi:hypothetical protein
MRHLRTKKYLGGGLSLSPSMHRRAYLALAWNLGPGFGDALGRV